MENEDEKPNSIQSLPFDILLMVLKYTSVCDIVNFGSTCKQFNELVKSTQGLWKSKLRNSVNAIVYGHIEKNTDGNWYNEVKKYTNLQSEIHARLVDMSAYYYRCKNEITLYDVRQFLNNSFTDGLAYHCTIDVLQELLKKGICVTKKPFTLTEWYYAKVCLRHLMHPYLTIQWVQAHVKNDLPPEFVLNFFIQWVDPLKMHTDDHVNDAISSLASMVERELKKVSAGKSLPVTELCANGEITETQIIAAISHVIYKEKRMAPVSVANLETLDIVKVIEMGCGHDIVIAAIYHAVAKRFGVRCELIAFPNHLFLELRSSQDRTSQQVYKIQLDSGKLVAKRTCPFSRHDGVPNNYKYCPDSLLQFVISAFLMPMGSYKTWYMQNAIYLLDFLSTNPNGDNMYKTYLPYLLDNTHLPVLCSPINITSMTDEQLKLITLLSYLTKSPPPHRKEEVVKRRTGDIKYAVGMVVQHREYDYLCVVRGWERGGGAAAGERGGGAAVAGGVRPWPSQPFYIVVAIDQSDRYIAQENLVDVPRPSRLYHLEDIISREFTHFNGFAYEPNVHKRAEYPDDTAVSAQYRARALNLFGPEPELHASAVLP